MHWLLLRPATLILVHVIGIPLVYGLGKACGAKEVNKKMMPEPEHP